MPTTERTPRIIAHRGSSESLPEQTLKAYVRAIAEGADALECDVRLTADSHLVCVHDRRVERTSNGRGPVSTLELTTLQGLDFGSCKQAHSTDIEMPDVDRERDMLLTQRQEHVPLAVHVGHLDIGAVSLLTGAEVKTLESGQLKCGDRAPAVRGAFNPAVVNTHQM